MTLWGESEIPEERVEIFYNCNMDVRNLEGE